MRHAFVLMLVGLVAACSDDESASSGTAAGGAANSSNASNTTSSGAAGNGGTGGALPIDCAPLPAPSGTVVNVTAAQAAELPNLAQTAGPGATLLLEDGTYPLGASVQLTADGMSLRGASGDATKVILDGSYTVNELVVITGSQVTVADVTITRAIHHPIHIYPPGPGVDVLDTYVYRTRLIDGGQQFIKVNPIMGQQGWIDDGRVECSTFQLTDEGRPHVEPCCGGCYTGGIDAHSAQGWQVRGNVFTGIYCPMGLAEHAVHFWKGSRDTLVENNVIVNCARGVGFGLDQGTGERVYPDNPYGGLNLAHYDGIIRNNVIYADIPYFDTGIEIDDARQPVIVHNTVISTDAVTNFFSSIDYRFPQTVVLLHNNLTRRITARDGAMGTVSNNLENTPLDYFIAVPDDFHLAASATQAIDQGLALDPSIAGLDMDGDPHGAAPDLGADEL